eukprot:1639929-Rhodomonas_salina.1
MAGFLVSLETASDGFVTVSVPELLDVDSEVVIVRFKVPVLLLKKSSEVFARMFEGEWKEARDKTLQITQFTASAFRLFLDMLSISFAGLPNAIERRYNTITCETIHAVLPIAEYYQVVRVRQAVIAAVQHCVKEQSKQDMFAVTNTTGASWFSRLLSRFATSPADLDST